MIRWNKDYIKSGRKPIHQNFVVVNDDDDLISIHQTEEEAEVAKEKYLSENPERRAKVIENSRKLIKSDSSDDITIPAYSEYYDELVTRLEDSEYVSVDKTRTVNGGEICYVNGDIVFKHPRTDDYVPLKRIELHADDSVTLYEDKFGGGGWAAKFIPLEEIFINVGTDRDDEKYVNCNGEEMDTYSYSKITSSRKIIKSSAARIFSANSNSIAKAIEKGTGLNRSKKNSKYGQALNKNGIAYAQEFRGYSFDGDFHVVNDYGESYKIKFDRDIPDEKKQEIIDVLNGLGGNATMANGYIRFELSEDENKWYGSAGRYRKGKFRLNKSYKDGYWVLYGDNGYKQEFYAISPSSAKHDADLLIEKYSEGNNTNQSESIESSRKAIKSEFDIGTRVYNQDYMGGKGKLWDKYGSVTKIIDDDTVEVKWDSGKKEERKTDSIYKVKETELSDVHNIKSSAGKKTNLPKNLVRQVLSNKITEDQAINRVMISQKCNRGVARVIFNRWMDQNRDSIIKSDAAIAEIQNEFNPDGNLDSWAEIYMPGSGKANTKGGELVRAAQRILAAYYASEAMIGRGLGNELVNPAARYIVENTEFELNSDIQEMLDHDIHYDDSEYDSWLKSFETKFEDYLRNNSELFSEANDDDMDDYRKDEDSEFFLNKCYVEDDNGNEYFIENEDGEWKCTDIVASNENAYSVGDEISEGDVFFEKVNKSEEYGSFEENGTTYFYEASGNPGENGDFDTFKITEVQFTDQLFEKDSFVDYEKLEELCEDGKLFDVNGNQIHIEDFQRI